MSVNRKGAYTADDDIVDFILGITFEIWEQRGVDLIHQYYAADSVVWGLDGITHGAAAVVDGTNETLASFPDRNLIAENVIWSGSRADGYYTSHRLLSVATNDGPSAYGPPTGTRIRMTNIADCVVENGMIVREWLVRDNMALALQLGAEPISAARDMAERQTAELANWLNDESQRVRSTENPIAVRSPHSPRLDPTTFAWHTLASSWSGDRSSFNDAYAPYCVLHRTPLKHYSGSENIFGYYESLREAFGNARYSVDHVASQPVGENGVDIAVRWSVAGEHRGEFYGVGSTARPIFIMGVTHWRCLNDKIIAESTVFDDLAVLSQIVAA